MNYDDFCEKVFADCTPCWHLCTPGNFQSIIFKENEDYVYGMNLVALSAAAFSLKVQIHTFQIMSNHLHFVLSGEKDAVVQFFEYFRKRLSKYMSLKGNGSYIKELIHNLIPITDLHYMRNVIAYVNRNGYLTDSNSTPFTYPWGANVIFFSGKQYLLKCIYVKNLSVKKKREIFHSHTVVVPEEYYLVNEHIYPGCYVKREIVENLFRSAHHYFNLVSRQVESFISIATELGDKILYTDNELYSAVCSISAKKFEVAPKILDKTQKIEIAKDLHHKYNASNKQIKRVLRIDEAIIEELFPKNGGGGN